MHAQNGGTAGLVRQQMAALGAQGVQLLEPAFPALGPAARVGQKMQQPAGQTLHHRQGAEGDEPHDDARHDSVGPGQIPQHTVGVGRHPGSARQKQHGGVKQDGCLVEDVLQGHQPHAGADVQPAPVEIPRLKRHRPCAEAHHIAEGPHPCIVDALPQREMGQTAADDEPAGYALEKRVAQAHGQCQKPLPEGEPAQRLGDLGPVLPEDEHHDAGQQGQNAQREQGLSARRGGGGGRTHAGTPFKFQQKTDCDKLLGEYITVRRGVCEQLPNFLPQFRQDDKERGAYSPVSSFTACCKLSENACLE